MLIRACVSQMLKLSPELTAPMSLSIQGWDGTITLSFPETPACLGTVDHMTPLPY